ncbi:MAG TPA: fatty acid desaturase [Solirubrobacteraceae bacterium]|nr:fatty acid desaturase [Solirubrobacteraceae bacterium]
MSAPPPVQPAAPGVDAGCRPGPQPARAGAPGDASRARAPGDASRAGAPGDASRAGAPGDASRAAAPGDREVGPPALIDRVANVLAMLVPLALLGLAAWRAWGGALRWPDLVALVLTYALTGLGVTVGFHRLLTHRSFKTSPALRALLAALGSAAVEGPVIEWVANHRKHHRFSDVPGDPHSPHVERGHGFRGALAGLYHAHVGWIFAGASLACRERYAKDLLADPVVAFIDRTFLAWVLAGLLFPFGVGYALTGSLAGGLTGLLWGGAVRMFFLHHATFSINSLCHFFGRRSFATADQSRNLAWLALPTFGEAWHNNHHAFPTSARHGLRWWQLDPSAWVIAALARAGLAWDVVQIAPQRVRAMTAERRL